MLGSLQNSLVVVPWSRAYKILFIKFVSKSSELLCVHMTVF